MVAASSTMPASVVTQPTSTTLPTSQSGVSGTNTTLNENDFLTLMTAQLENQDPLNPMSSSDFAAELAQFSTASGVQDLQTTVSGIGTQLSTAMGMQASSLVGKYVAVNGSTLALGSSGTAAGAFNLAAAAQNVVVTVSDATGKQVATIPLGAMTAGTQTFAWDGEESDGSTADAGNYTFQVSATAASGAAVTATPYAVVPVTGVSLGGQSGPMLDVGDGLAPVALSAVAQVY